MKNILLLMTLSLSLFTVACGEDNSTCQEAYDEISTCPNANKDEEAIKVCKSSDKKDDIIECSNKGDCDEIEKCLLKVAFSSL